MLRLGLTGGIGMGKTTASTFLAGLGLAIADSDVIARELVEPGQPAAEAIRSAFGASVFGADGRLDRAALASVVFSDPSARSKLESILHPEIRRRWTGQLLEWSAAGLRASCVVVPLLFETGAEVAFDRVVCVACTPASQLERLQGRGWSRQEIERRLQAQWPIEKKIARSHHVIWTEGDRSVHESQWRRLTQSLVLSEGSGPGGDVNTRE